MVAQRSKAIEFVAKHKITVEKLASTDRESLIDGQLEKWWENLERKSLPEKWDALVGLVGSPDRLRDGNWHFDREMLVKFDDIRHDCVHHSGSSLTTHDLGEFVKQFERAHFVWGIEVAKSLNVKIPAQIVFGIQTTRDAEKFRNRSRVESK
jgi:hypothetical protein